MNKYDVIVVGGGTAGCAAAYMAGKLGLKTLLIEKSIHLGGTITSALVVPAMKSGEHQINTEFYKELISELHSIGPPFLCSFSNFLRPSSFIFFNSFNCFDVRIDSNSFIFCILSS